MNRTVEAIKNGQVVSTEELFEVVNAYVLATLSVVNVDKEKVLSMQVNHYEKSCGCYKFTQTCQLFDGVAYYLKPEDLVSVKADYHKKANAFYITCELKNSMELWLMIVNVSGSEDKIESDGFYETDIYDIQDFLEGVIHEKNGYYCILARITDVFGFDFKMRNPIRTYINTLDDSDWKLHISYDANTFEVPVVDDSVNLFYTKETDNSKEIIVKPYGQPFMEIEMLFFKRHEQA